ncbi:transglutaminase family protein [Pseudohongiella spirulinae]|uniref:transglutaminase family protein n=1 Tax=Pseudohongiella spirulinae TaxID=1249552 RepID=UPI000717B18B|nr:transglutaminase family protein [Pseudohongiella spirulinae]
MRFFAISLLFFCITLQADELLIDRSNFGASEQPAWTALTDFELQVLARFQGPAKQVQRPSAQDLMALFVLASGDVRHRAQYRALQDVINAFVSENQQISLIDNERERGRELLLAMHEQLLTSVYDEDQSALSVLLRTGVYNCISSALLYIVLAEEFGLHASGVIMPSHAFVQLSLLDGSDIEVETTSADGFNVIRDAQFFAEQADDWFTERRLLVASYEDYELRRVVSATQLGLENMWSQHVSELRMPYADRLRMAELKGLLEPAEIEAQHNRLVYYYRESDFLRRHDDRAWNQLMRRIADFLQSNRSLVLSDDMSETMDGDIRLPLFLLLAHQSAWFLRDEESLNRGLQLARDVIRYLPDDLRDADIVYASAQQAIEQFYLDSAYQQWQQRNWHRVIALYQEYLDMELRSGNRQAIEQNLESAYLNSFQQYWFDEERDEALAQLQVCVIRLPAADQCQARLREVGR